MLFPASFAVLFLLLWALFFAAGPFFERLFARVANRTAAFRYNDYVPVAAVLIAGAAVAALIGNQFVDLAELVHSRSPELDRVDAAMHAWAAGTRTPGSTAFFTVMTILGNPPVLAGLALGLSVALALRNHWRWSVYLIATGLTGGLINLQLKAYFARARPDLAEALRQAHGYSFPSGHAMGAVVVFGSAAYVLFRLFTTWRSRSAALAGSASLITAIAFSRVYLGVHWISDIAAGLAAGFVWLLAATLAYETFRRIHRVRSMRKARAERISGGE
ncbi:MAG: phosphatase PAP2 family protein [Thermoanaerobaculia bacterium]